MSTTPKLQPSIEMEQFHTWGSSDVDKEKWKQLISKARHGLNVANRNLCMKVEMAKEIRTSSSRDKLESAVEESNEQAAFLAAVTEMFEEVMMDDEEMKTEVETVSQGVASMTAKNKKDTAVAITALAAVTKTVESQEERVQRVERREDQRGGVGPGQDGQHHQDPPLAPKVTIAHDLKPEHYSNMMGFTELQDWVTRATVYAQASGISMQSNPVQLAYLQALISTDEWTQLKQTFEMNDINTDNLSFQAGLEAVRELWHRQNDLYSLRLRCLNNKFKGKSYNDLLTWWITWQKEARLCSLLTLSQEDFSALLLITNMPVAYRVELMTANTRPSLAQTVEFIDRKAQVEIICKNTDRIKSSKSKQPVNNVVEQEDKHQSTKAPKC